MKQTKASRNLAIMSLTILGGGIIAIMLGVVFNDGELRMDDGGWVTAAFLSIREVFSKIEKIVLGSIEPAQLPGAMLSDKE